MPMPASWEIRSVAAGASDIDGVRHDRGRHQSWFILTTTLIASSMRSRA
jgi:hypothetical protein